MVSTVLRAPVHRFRLEPLRLDRLGFRAGCVYELVRACAGVHDRPCPRQMAGAVARRDEESPLAGIASRPPEVRAPLVRARAQHNARDSCRIARLLQQGAHSFFGRVGHADTGRPACAMLQLWQGSPPSRPRRCHLGPRAARRRVSKRVTDRDLSPPGRPELAVDHQTQRTDNRRT
jgi:hypothetical protein